ncbi:MAG TPA: hypothetical protein PKG95_00570 [Anaerolineaceae bacterium]|nr:hypothetical protein [Anaerolineaceae bacterium]
MTTTSPKKDEENHPGNASPEVQKQEPALEAVEKRNKQWHWPSWITVGVIVAGIGLSTFLWFRFPQAQNAMLRIAILIGIVGLYPISYLAYKDLGKSRREKIERDIYLLGLGREIERKALDELYKNIYSPIQYTAYIGLIVLASLLMILVYFQRDLLEIIAPPEVLTLVFYGYLGAYVFSIQDLIRRYNTFDLQPQVYSSILMRMVTAVLIVLVGASVILASGGRLVADTAQSDTTLTVSNNVATLPQPTLQTTPASTIFATPTPIGQAATAVIPTPIAGGVTAPTAITGGSTAPTPITNVLMATQAVQVNGATITTTIETSPASETATGDAAGWAAVLAFVIGMFPTSGIRWFVTRASRVLGEQERYRPHELRLRTLLGLNEYHEARLREMGIDDAQNLATADLRRLLLTTQFDTQTVINWVDQAILYCKVGDKIINCRDLNITTFHELRRAWLNLVISETAGSVGADAEALETAPSGGSVANPGLLTRLLVMLGLSNQEELRSLVNYANYPNYAYINEFYNRTATVAHELANEGEEAIIGAPEETDFNAVIKANEGYLDQVEQAKPRAKILYRLATAYYYRFMDTGQPKDLASSTEHLTEALKLDAGFTEAYYLRAVVKFKLAQLASDPAGAGMYDEIIADCEEAIKRDSTHPKAYNLRGLTYSLLHYFDLAESDLDRAIDLDHWNGEAYLNRARVANATDRCGQAIADLERANLLRVDSVDLWLTWGVALLGLGKPKDAVTKLSRALRNDPTFALALARRGFAYLLCGKPYYVQARQDLQAAVKQQPQLLEAWHNLGILESSQGFDTAAVAAFTQVLDAEQNNFISRFYRAGALARLADIEGAKADYQYILENASAQSSEYQLSQSELAKLPSNS